MVDWASTKTSHAYTRACFVSQFIFVFVVENLSEFYLFPLNLILNAVRAAFLKQVFGVPLMKSDKR